MDRTLSGATTPGQSGPGSNGKEGVLLIPQSSSISGASPSPRAPPSVLGGARGVMVIFVGNGHDDTSSNPGRD